MNLRRATIAAHLLLAGALGTAAAWLLWISVSYSPDPADPWPVGPDFLGIPMAVGTIVCVVVIAVALRSWMRSASRLGLAIADLLGVAALFLIGIAIPAVFATSILAILVLAGGTVAANSPRSRIASTGVPDDGSSDS